jgi:signal transduction histidine kinase/ligand-binding sensor domain-containing protein
MTPKALFTFFGAMMMALAQTAWGQRTWNWRVYKAFDGLPEPACISVAIAPQGKVLVRHVSQPLISELDGYNISTLPSPDGGKGRVYESPAGQLWMAVPEGLQEFREGSWVLHRVPEIAAVSSKDSQRTSTPIPLCPVRQGRVLILLPDRLLDFNAEATEGSQVTVLRSVNQTQLERFTGLLLARDGGLWISGAHGLLKVAGPLRTLKADSEWREYLAPKSLEIQSLTEPHEDGDGSVTMVGDLSKSNLKIIVHFDGQDWTTQSAGAEQILFGWRGSDTSYWAATGESLFQWGLDRGEMVENEEILARRYYDLAVEPGGVFWLATTEGLFRFSPLTWRCPKPLQKLRSLVHCLTSDPEGRLWWLSGGALHLLQADQHQEFALPATSFRNVQSAHALFVLKDGTLVFDSGDRLFQFRPGKGVFDPIPSGAAPRKLRAIGLLKDGRLCVQSVEEAAGQNGPWEIYDGSGFAPFPDAASDGPALVNLAILFAAQNGDLWLGGESGTAWFHDKKWRTFASTDKTTPEGTLAFAESAEGKIWCATQDKVWEFDGKNWLTVPRGFDRINALLRSRDGSLWVASNSSLHRFFQGAWVENGLEEGLPSVAIRDICEDSRGRIWAATTHGLSLYHPEADPDPPQTSIQKLSETEKNVPEGGLITVVFNGQDKWKYTPRGRLLYSYRLDEQEWSPFAEGNGVSFPDLPAGKHYFQVRAMDRNCNIDPKPAKIDFAIVLPWYKEVRLVSISLTALAVALFFAALAFNRHRRLVRSYAEVEKKVAQRTRELELANRELLHSQKMNALGTLAAGIAHDFNNILSIIKGSAQIIEDNLENPQKVSTRVERIKTVVEQGSGIVKAMLGFSRDSDQPAGICDLNLVVSDTLKLLGDRFLREIQVSFEPMPNLPEGSGSKDFIQQILLNFIFNAAESSAKRKQIILATQLLNKLPPDLVLMPAHSDSYVGVSVRDFGCGILPENMPRIFEPFFTTKAFSVRRGTGLGLSMVYELARKMSAGIAVESIVDQGSAFTLILPVRNGKQVEKNEAGRESRVELSHDQ